MRHVVTGKQEVAGLALSPAERSKRYRLRKKLARDAPLALVGRPVGNENARRHGAYGRDLDAAVQRRLTGLPGYLAQPAFADVTEIVFRRVERAKRLGEWVQEMGEEAAGTPRRAGGSSPEEISRHADDSAMRGLGALGLTPQSAAKFAARLERSMQPDLAQLAAEARLEGWAEENGDA